VCSRSLDVDSAADVSKMHASSILGVEANSVCRCPCRFGLNIFLSSISRDQLLTPTLVGSKHMSTEASYFYPEDGGSFYIRNVGSTVHFHSVQR
jgi:hypothetical protein